MSVRSGGTHHGYGKSNATSRRAYCIVLPPVGSLQRDYYGYFLLPLAVRNFASYSPPLFPVGPGELEEWQIIHRLDEAISVDVSRVTSEV